MKYKKGVILDIDGVLINQQEIIQHSLAGLIKLKQKKIPFVLLSNNISKSQQFKAFQMNQLYGQKIFEPDQIILNFTPLGDIFSNLQRCLIVGREEFQQLVKSKFSKYITTYEIEQLFPNLFDCSSGQSDLKEQIKKRLDIQQINDIHSLKITKIILMMTPVSWEKHLQLILNLYLDQKRKFQPNKNYSFICTIRDQFLLNNQKKPILTIGSFAFSLQDIFKRKFNHDLKIVYFGKPQSTSFNFAINRLNQLFGQIQQIVMIGDNPQTDIKGANRMGLKSLLVRTGVFRGEELPTESKPTEICANVQQALDLIINQKI